MAKKTDDDDIVQVNIRMLRKLKAAGEASAEAGHRNFSQLLIMLLTTHLEKEGRWPPKR